MKTEELIISQRTFNIATDVNAAFTLIVYGSYANRYISAATNKAIVLFFTWGFEGDKKK
jgi:hypothetical protein